MSQPPPPLPLAQQDQQHAADIEFTPIVAPTAHRTDPLGFVWDIQANPCFRSSLMWGIGIGAALGIHSFTRHRSHFRAGDTAVKAMVGVSGVTWLWCRYRAREEKKLFDAVFEAQMRAKQKKLDTSHPDAEPLTTTVTAANDR